jgi:hypothetical protein
LKSKARADKFELFNLRNERIISRITERLNIQSVFIQNTVVYIQSNIEKIDKESYKQFIAQTQNQFSSIGTFSTGLNTYITKDQLGDIREKNAKRELS